MKRTKLAASFLLVATLFLTGCVTKKEFVNLQTDYNKLKDEKSALDKSYQDAQIQLAEYRTQSKSLEDRLSEARKNNPARIARQEPPAELAREYQHLQTRR